MSRVVQCVNISCVKYSKIYFSKIKGEDDITYIIDGGHRIRSICEYIDGSKKLNSTKKGKFIDLSDEEKSFFNNYPLAIHTYENIDDVESRDIFNELQHSRPMTNAEICNSYASYLVDYLSSLDNLNINNLTLCEILECKNNNFPHPKCHNYLLILIQLFSYFDGDSSISSLKDCNGGNTCVTYIKRFKQDDLSDEYKNTFENILKVYFNFIYTLPDKNNLKTTTIFSIYHYLVWHEIYNYDTFFTNLNETLLHDLMEYDDLKKTIESLRKKGKEDEADKVRESVKNYNVNIKEWFDSTVVRGTTYSNGKEIRYLILKNMFNYKEKKIEMDDVSEVMEVVNKIE